jgi:hypothetical protein
MMVTKKLSAVPLFDDKKAKKSERRMLTIKAGTESGV